MVQKLVTFQSEREFDAFSGQIEERLFLKLYVAARTSGLLASISDRDWKTLCVLATYMNAEGFCHPSQAELARALGCSRQMANERINHLAQFRFEGKPVLMIVKDERGEHGTWVNNRYQVLPLSQLSIFNGNGDPAATEAAAPRDERPPAPAPAHTVNSTVSSSLDTVESLDATVSSPTVTVPLDTNKNQLKNKNRNLSKLRKGHIPLDETALTKGGGETSDSPESIGSVLSRQSLPISPHPDDDARGVIVAYLQDFARELHDQAPLRSSVTRAYHLYQRANTDLNSFIAAMYAARARTQEHSGSIRTTVPGQAVKAKMAFWFACLEEGLGLRGNG